VIEALRIRDLTDYIVQAPKEIEEITFTERKLPEGAKSFSAWAAGEDYPDGLLQAITYAADRLGDLEDYPEVYWTESKTDAMSKRIIFPFTWNGKNVGYSGRTFKKIIKPKYMVAVDSDYVYGLDNLIKESEFVLVFEGVIDALLMNGLAVLSNKISAEQADQIEQLGKQVIVVPDMSEDGKPLINAAIEYDWHVAFPDWDNDVKDAGEAVQRYGKLFTLKSIISNVATNATKIELLKRRIHD